MAFIYNLIAKLVRTINYLNQIIMLLTTKRMVNSTVLGVGLLLSGLTFAQTSDLLISEYVEGSSNNKYVEIFNGTSAPVNLADYQIRLHSNGSVAPSITNTLSGTLPVGGTVVYRNSAAVGYAGASTVLTSMQYNGDDAVVLFKISTGLPVDIFGVIGCDPGTQWLSASNRTLDRTLRRKSNVLSGVTVNPSCTSSSGDFTSLESQWTEFPIDNAAGLGSHFVSGPPPVVNLGADQSICAGASIVLNSGGDGTSFLWSTGETTSTITVSAAGTYSVTVSNANGSTTDAINISVYPPTALAISNPSTICAGASTEICASLILNELFISEYVEGSSLNKCVEIYNGTGAAVDLGAQGYSINITFNGGTSTLSIPLSGVVANGATHVLCDNDAASNFLSVANQTTTSSLWNGDDAIVLRKNGVAVDIFGVINSDPGAQWSSGGNSTENATLRRNGSVTSGITTNPSGTGTGAFTTLGTEWTSGALDDASGLGSHEVTGSGNFAWSTGATTLCTTVSPSAATNYTFSYTTVEGCVTDISTSLAVSNVAISATSTPVLCNGGTSTVTVSATGGTAPYSGTGTFNVSAGTYSYTVTDASGCSASTSITVAEPTQVVATSSSTSIACIGGTADVSVSATGGTAPYSGTGTFSVSAGTYFYTVTDANGCSTSTSITVTEPTQVVAASSATSIACNGGTADVSVSATGGTAPYSGTGTFTVSAGTYAYTVTDANGCSASTSITVTEPTQVVASSSANPVACNGGLTDVTIGATGGTAPYVGTGTFSQAAGTYSYAVMDANGCTATTTITITEPTALVATASAPNSVCVNQSGDVTIAATGGTAPYSGTGTFVQAGGTQTYTVTDANGCTNTISVTIVVNQGPDVDAGDCETVYFGYAPEACATLTATSSSAISYAWSNGFNGASQTVCPQTTTNYTVTVTDANGCTAQSTVTVNVIDVRCGKNNDKVLICKVPPGNPSNTQQLCVSPNAVPAQLATGAYLGTCGQIDPCTGMAKSNLSEPTVANQVENFNMTVYPSPLNTGDILHVAFSGVEEEVTIQLFSLSGQLVGSTTVQSTGTDEQVVELSTAKLTDGTYLCKLTGATGETATQRFTVVK